MRTKFNKLTLQERKLREYRKKVFVKNNLDFFDTLHKDQDFYNKECKTIARKARYFVGWSITTYYRDIIWVLYSNIYIKVFLGVNHIIAKNSKRRIN